MSAGLKTFNTAYPINIAFENRYKDSNTPTLYIVDENTSPDLQKVRIKLSPVGGKQLQFKAKGYASPKVAHAPFVPSTPSMAPSNAQVTPSDDDFHLAIAIRPGVLKSDLVPQFSNIFEQAVKKSITSNTVYGPVIRSTDGALVWYCLFQNTVDVLTGLDFELEGVSASPGVGSRTSQIEICFRDVIVGGNSASLSFSRTTHIDVINHQGSTYAPFYFGVAGSNEFINGQTRGQDLNCYFETIDRKPVQFGPDTKFTFKFSYDDETTSPLMHFGDFDDVDGITWKTNGDHANLGVTPYNRHNQYKGQANINFNGQYTPNETGATVVSVGPGGVGHASSGYISFSQTFHHVKACNYANPEYTSAEALKGHYKKLIGDSLNSYSTGTNSPKSIGDTFISHVNVKNYLDAIDWKTEQVSDDFFTQSNSVAESYLPSIFNHPDPSNYGWVGSQNLLTAYVNLGPNNSHGVPQSSPEKQHEFNSTYTLNYKEPFSTEDWMNISKINNSRLMAVGFGSSYRFFACIYVFQANVQWSNYWHYLQNPGAPSGGGWGNSYKVNPNIWSEPNFVDFLTLNIVPLVDNLVSISKEKGLGDFFQGTGNLLVPSQGLYNYFRAMYAAYRNYKADQYVATPLINLNEPLSEKIWKSAYKNMVDYAGKQGNASSISTDPSVTIQGIGSTYRFTNQSFLSFVNDYISAPSFATDFPVSVYTQPHSTVSIGVAGTDPVNYLVPSAALFDYLYSLYQHQIYKAAATRIEANNEQVLHYYINPVSCAFHFTNVKLSGNLGQVLLNVKVENLPGYWDTEFQIPIIKKASS